jgi:hypothetical protein
MTLHMLLNHSVPAWVVVALVGLFVLLETYRVFVAGRSGDVQQAWMDHASEHLATHQTSLETHRASIQVLKKAVDHLSGGDD